MKSGDIDESKSGIYVVVVIALFFAALSGGFALFGGRPVSAQSAPLATYTGTTIEPGVLTVASDLVSPPMSFLDSEGNPTGFEQDIVAAIAERLGLELNYLPPVPFSDIDGEVLSGKADIGVSAITYGDLPSAEGPLLASDSFLISGRSLIMRTDTPFESIEALNVPETIVCVQSGSSNDEWVTKNLPNAQIVRLAEASSGLTSVARGEYTLAVYDRVSANYWINNVFSMLTVPYEMGDVDKYCIVCAPTNQPLMDAINQALASLEADGTLNSLEVKWFGHPIQ